jgi:hypothetical protein
MFAKCGTGTCTAGWYSGQLLDPTAPGFQSWIWNSSQLGQLYNQGISMWWLDLPEPESEPANAVYTAGPSAMIHNVYSNLYSKAYYQGQLALAPNTRPYILTRCGSAGIQKYGTTLWTGDIFSNYVTMQAHVPEGQSASLSGIPWWTMDNGGFQATNATFGSQQYYKNDEYGAHALMYGRWMEFSCFIPVARSHGVKDDEPYKFTRVSAACKYYLQLRYRLLPYIYSYAWECHNDGLPIQRAMVLEYQSDANVYSKKLQYLFGQEFMVAPVVTESTTVANVYFPAGKWIEYDSGTVYTGPGSANVPAPQSELPIFVKSGSIIPMAPFMNYTSQKKWDPLTLNIYPDGISQFTMYQDDDSTQSYAVSNAYTLTTITSALVPSQQEVVTLTQSNNLFVPTAYEYEIHLPGQVTVPSPVTFNGVAVTPLASQSAYAAAVTGMWWDSTKKVLWAKCATSSAATYVFAVSLNGNPVSTKSAVSLGALPRSFDMKLLPGKGAGAEPSLQFAVPKDGSSLRISLFDLAGRQIAVLAQGRFSAGYHTVSACGPGNRLSGHSGRYLCRMEADRFEKTVKVMMVR